jgi:Ca2+-dependent lipid-binding protein
MLKGKPYGSLTYSVSYYPVAVPVKDESGAEVPIESASGILQLTISQAKSLDPKHSLAKQYSPYTIAKMEGKEVMRTKVLKRTNNPVWEVTAELGAPCRWVALMQSECA